MIMHFFLASKSEFKSIFGQTLLSEHTMGIDYIYTI